MCARLEPSQVRSAIFTRSRRLRAACEHQSPRAHSQLTPRRVPSLVSAVHSRRCRTTSRDESELSELVYHRVRVRRGASAMAARHRECWAHSVPARRAGEAAAATVGRLWVGWRVRRGGEPAQARPLGCAGGMCKRARGAEAVGGIAWAALSDVSFARVSQCFRVLAMFARPPSQKIVDEGIVLSW